MLYWKINKAVEENSSSNYFSNYELRMMDKAMATPKVGTFLDPNSEYVGNASGYDPPQDRLMQLQKKFRTKRDLYQYLDSRGK